MLMSNRWLGILACLLASWVGWAPRVSGEDVQFVTSSEFTAWEQRVKALERRLATYEGPGAVDTIAAPGSAEEAYVDDSCGEFVYSTPGLTVQAELLFLRAYNSDADFDSDSDARRFKESVRLSAGWTGESGVGVRARWFEFDLNSLDSNFLLQVFDLELTSRIELSRDWYLTASGGSRYAEYFESGEANKLSHSLGPILGLEIGRAVTDNVSLYASGRQGLVFGRDFAGNDPAVFASEIQLGADLHYTLSGTTTLFGRVAWEGQFWTGMATEDAETFGLTGLVLSLGLTR